MFLEEGAKKKGQVLDEVLLIFLSILVGISNDRTQREHLKRKVVKSMPSFSSTDQ